MLKIFFLILIINSKLNNKKKNLNKDDFSNSDCEIVNECKYCSYNEMLNVEECSKYGF
jgi:hypothetical protein